MMHGKALLFEDNAVAEQILATRDPRTIKALGRKVKGFNEKVWKKHRENIVYCNNRAKFTQNDHLLWALVETTGTLVEASPSDRIWGIGMSVKNDKHLNPLEWNGLNLLGFALMKVRDELCK